jgi:kynurenine formamidase
LSFKVETDSISDKVTIFNQLFMKRILSFLLLPVLIGCSSSKKLAFEKGRWIDLTYAFSNESIYWPTAEPFKLDTAFEGTTPGGFFYSAFNFSAAEHGGTHLDAPYHFAKGKWTTDQIPLENLTGRAVVIDVSSRALKDADYLISVQDVEAWEKANGRIPDGSIVLFRTGYGTYYPDATKYLGTTKRGTEGVALLHFPGIDPQLAEWIVQNRKIKAVGLDTPSVDYGQSKDFKTHQVLYGHNICGFENVANLDRLPVKNAYVIALPMKIKGGSGGPLRIVAWLVE